MTVDEIDDYQNWINANIEHIVEQYTVSDPEAPEDIYECVLDDDYPDVYDSWLEGLTFEDVPDDFISNMYERFLEGGNDE